MSLEFSNFRESNLKSEFMIQFWCKRGHFSATSGQDSLQEMKDWEKVRYFSDQLLSEGKSLTKQNRVEELND